MLPLEDLMTRLKTLDEPEAAKGNHRLLFKQQ